MNDPRGSMWRRWDLHVHTPASLYHRYGGGGDVWERFVKALEELPPEFSVIGINDYLFLDGYRKILEYKTRGRLQNITTFLPVLEFRLSKFAGTDTKLRRINYHVIFSNELTADQIEQQFLSRLTAKYQLDPDCKNSWNGVITRDALRDLGQSIIDSAPEGRKAEYLTPLIEGFNNLNLSIECINEALKSRYFQNKYITAIGKTEWASLKWNDQSIGEKKSLINQADCVFISAENSAAYDNAKHTLTEQKVNDKLLDCSDAHGWAGSEDKDSLGNCDLWVKADPTFRGLQHALLEFSERIYVGTEPAKTKSVRSNPGHYLRSVSCKKIDGAGLHAKWFAFELPLNPGLVAIIGNKGNGKSALADILALGGNSSHESHFSFLNKNKFRSAKDNLSRHFEGVIEWESGVIRSYNLADAYSPEDAEKLRYIPQSYLERLCNELVHDGESAFNRELHSVIFSHLSIAERLGKRSLTDLLNYQGEEILDRINDLKGDLSKLNREIAEVEQLSSPERKRELDKRLAESLKELDMAKRAEPAKVPEPDSDPAAKKAMQSIQATIDANAARAKVLEEKISQASSRKRELLSQIARSEKVSQRIRNLEDYHRQQRRESEEEVDALGFRWDDLVQLTVDGGALKALTQKLTEEDDELKGVLDEQSPGSSSSQLRALQLETKRLRGQLDAPTRKHQEYLAAQKEWRIKVDKLEKDLDDPDSVASIRAEHERLARLPAELSSLEEKRLEITGQIYGLIDELRDQCRKLYRPVQDFIKAHQTLATSINLSFDVNIGESNLATDLSDWVNKGRSGSFQGAEAGKTLIREVIDRNTFNTLEGTNAFISDFTECLKNDQSSNPPRPLSVASQLKGNRSVSQFYDFLFGLEYLAPRYVLKLDGKELSELSPGERGLLLLLFYLLVEKNDWPLILDQPEENLDNETVHRVLVPSLQLAKRRRQIIVVTHNPNLAVVADADQIVSASIDKQSDCAVKYVSGALENPVANEFVVRYLEGTLPAFMNRDRKYIRGN